MKKGLSLTPGAFAMTVFIWMVAIVCGALQLTTVHAQEPAWTVIEYPLDEEVAVELVPKLLPDAKGKATIRRGSEETAIRVEISGLGDDPTKYHLYAIDHTGRINSLGAIDIVDGAGELSTKTTSNKFMLLVSNEPDLIAISAATPVALTSSVPSGFTVLPRETQLEETETREATPRYDVPLLGLSDLRLGAEVPLKVDFSTVDGRADASIKRLKGGTTQIKMRLYSAGHTLTDGQPGRYVLWSISPDGSYKRIGDVATIRKRTVAKIETKTDLPDFGLFITAEASGAASPAGPVIAKVLK